MRWLIQFIDWNVQIQQVESQWKLLVKGSYHDCMKEQEYHMELEQKFLDLQVEADELYEFLTICKAQINHHIFKVAGSGSDYN